MTVGVGDRHPGGRGGGGQIDRLSGLRRIEIEEISYRKGQRYLLVVTCHDTGQLVWAGKKCTNETLGRFFR